MKSIIRDIGEIVWGTDSRLRQTVRDYLNPGIYTRNWLDKKQARYISPIKMFLLINLVYFLTLSFLNQYGLNFDTFVTSFENQIEVQLYSDLIRDSITGIIASSGLEQGKFAETYNSRIFTISNSLIIILCLLGAAVLYMINFRKSQLIYHHVTMGIYYGGYLLILFLVFNLLLAAFALILVYFNTFPNWLISELFVSSILVLFLLFFSSFSQNRMYNEHKAISFLKSVVITFLFAFAGIIIYRFILFWITISSILLFP